MKRFVVFALALLFAVLPLEARRRWAPVVAAATNSPPYSADLLEWWDTRTGDFATTGTGKLINTWTGRQNGLTMTGTTATRPQVISDGTNNYVTFSVDTTVAGTFTSGTFSDGELVKQTTSTAQPSYGVANGTQSAGGTLTLTGYYGGPGADASTTWVGQTSGAIFTPSGFPANQSPTENLVISNSFTWDKQARTIFIVMTRDVQSSATSYLMSMTGDTDGEYVASGPEHEHWNGSNSISTSHYLSSNLGTLYSAANGATDITLGLSAEAGTYAFNLNSAGTVSGGRLGSGASGGSPLGGANARCVIAYNRYLNSTERAAVNDWLTTTYGATSRSADTFIVNVGDSITEGSQSTNAAIMSYPAQMARLCAYQPKFSNRGLAGASIYPSAGIVISSTLTDTDFSRNAWATNKVIVVQAGTNDISVNGRSSAQIISDYGNWVTARRSATSGVIIVGCTIINKASFSGPQSIIQAAVNTWILTSGTFDYTVDLQADSRLQTTTNTTYFSLDQIHPNDTGYGVEASLIYTVLHAHSLAP